MNEHYENCLSEDTFFLWEGGGDCFGHIVNPFSLALEGSPSSLSFFAGLFVLYRPQVIDLWTINLKAIALVGLIEPRMEAKKSFKLKSHEHKKTLSEIINFICMTLHCETQTCLNPDTQAVVAKK